MNGSAVLVRVAALLALVMMLVGWNGGARAQVGSSKVLRSNTRRDDLYRMEEVVTVTPGGGTIQSPRFPSSYPRNLLLSWKLLSPTNTRVLLEFDGQFGLEEPENDVCRYDFVEVEDISETSTIVWGRWCGRGRPPRLTSKTNLFKVTFKSDDYFVARPGFKLYYSLLDDSPPPGSETNWEAVTVPLADVSLMAPEVSVATAGPWSAEAMDRSIAAFDTVEELLRHLNPDGWRQEMDALFTHTSQYRPRAYHTHSRTHKVDLDRLHEDVKRYSCTPRNVSVSLREELRATNAVFFPRCLLALRCGGNCACGTDDWRACTCSPAKTSQRLHEVLRFAPGVGVARPRSARVSWQLHEVFLTHHDKCDCVCPSRPPR